MAGRPKGSLHCFECGARFPTPDDVFSEDRYGNGFCRLCTVACWGSRENFQDYSIGAAYAVVRDAVFH